jgi:hypothetical protein
MVRILALAAGAATERRSAQALPGGAADVGADGEPVRAPLLRFGVAMR